MLLQSLDLMALQPETASKLLVAASADAAAVASDVLLPLLGSLRSASDNTGTQCLSVHV